MKNFTATVRLVFLVTCLWSRGPQLAEAHHSFAASFDGSKPITLAGTVTRVEWANPHMYFYLSVRSDRGKAVDWICEAAGPHTLFRHGWAKDSLKPGDMVKVIGYPARGGSSVASANQVILSNGRRMSGETDDRGPQP